jgi:hypothetical protein
MKLKPPFVLILFLFTSILASGQDKTKFIVLETGVNFIVVDPKESDYIRGDIPTYDVDGHLSRALRNRMSVFYVGAKVEMKTKNDMFRFSTGLRFSQITSSITKSRTPDYFYFLYKQDGLNTEYLRISELKQTSSYVGVPVEVRMFPFKPRLFRIYFMAGGEIGYQIATKNHIAFHDQNMNSYGDDVSDFFGKPNKLYSSLYIGAGAMLSKEGLPRMGFGINIPFVNEGSSTLFLPIGGGGVRVQVQIPF